MTIADEARDNAVPCEMVLYAYRKNNQGVVVSFVVHPDDMPDALATARIGSRWVGALVHVGDDERPIPQTEKGKARTSAATPSLAKDKPSEKAKREPRDWQDTPTAQQAGILINDASFAAYLRERHPLEWRETGEADACIKFMCGVTRKRDIAGNHKALVLWNQIVADYRIWGLAERVGA